MPKEQIRKRGKRKPKTETEYAPPPAAAAAVEPASAPDPVAAEAGAEVEAAEGGIHPSRLAFLKTGQRPPMPAPTAGAGNEEGGEGGEEEEGAADWTRGPRHDSEYPFGVLDPDVKAYFRNVEDQVKDWEGVGSVGEEREDRQMFLASVLAELRGHELQVATDPDVSVVFERLLPSLNDWGRRVVGDAVGDNWETLFRHRFGSHVAQTWLTLAAGTLDREARGVWPPQHVAAEKKRSTGDESEGVLPTMSELVTTLVDCLQPTLPTLLTQAHASPPVRLLLLVLTPNRALPSLDAREDRPGADIVRSKRSGKWRKGQGVQGKSIFGDDSSKGKGKAGGASEERAVPPDVAALRSNIREGLMERVSPVEWQGMGVDKVGSAAVQLLLEVENEDGTAKKPDSLLDILTEGLVTSVMSKTEDGQKKSKPKPQPYLSAQLVAVTGTRLFEAILRLAPKKVFKALWKTYFVGKLGKLAVHPYANYVVAAGVSRLDAEGVAAAVAEVQGVSGGRGMIKTGRTSVLNALAERAGQLDDTGASDAVVALVKSALDLPEGSSALVPCLMTLKTWPAYEALRTGADVPDDDDAVGSDADTDAEAQAAAKARHSAWENRRNRKPKESALEPNLQGCLLLQTLVGVSGANVAVLDSLFAQDTDVLVGYACSPVASHLLDRVLTAPAVPPKYRRKLYLAFMGRYADIAQDKLGSRVADTVWATADGFMREKIARSLVQHATTLGASQYGRFIARKLDLHLLERRPDEWRENVLGVRHHFAHQTDAAPVVPTLPAPREKRRNHETDEIDDVFAAVEKKRKHKH